jgi:hypothetical protein
MWDQILPLFVLYLLLNVASASPIQAQASNGTVVVTEASTLPALRKRAIPEITDSVVQGWSVDVISRAWWSSQVIGHWGFIAPPPEDGFGREDWRYGRTDNGKKTLPIAVSIIPTVHDSLERPLTLTAPVIQYG